MNEFCFTFCSFKGGTSKTSTVLNVGASLAMHHKKKVLLIDFDAQANLSIGLGFKLDIQETMVPVLKGEMNIRDVVQPTSIKGLEIITANTFLDGIERSTELSSSLYSHERLRKSISEISGDYDFCFIDTPPSFGWLTQSAFFASKYSVICAIPEIYSLYALEHLKIFHESIQEDHDIDVFGVVMAFWDERGAVNKSFLNDIFELFPNKMFDSKIRRDISVSRAALEGKSVFDFDKKGRASNDYKALADEILKKMEQR